ncbi:Kelch repeat-containing protein [Arcticibacter tournemirensis]|uniref:Galactose oxidase n=1 Tax=Arcticibacter tournemirensis TaxID=699437 RepID=A0A4Q0M7P2_9SPHI|nr:galactose oxidase [Arcticibacter tournemirensis]RXF69064.1 galactose oxidase [Arcticibacter tournemirensis]
MNKLFTGAFFLCLLTLFAGCSSSDDDDDLAGDWIRKSDFGGVSRRGAVSFVIDDIAYVGTGYNYGASSTDKRHLADFWSYDAARDNWDTIATFPGAPRTDAVAFSAGGKGYVGLGRNSLTDEKYKDFYEYDPGTNKWTKIADFPGAGGRYYAVSFSINNIGYVGSGTDGNNDQQDFYKYDPSKSTPGWEKISNIKTKRVMAFSFVIGNIAYVGGGQNNGALVPSFYAYDPSNDTWTRKISLYPDGDDEESDEIQENDDYNYNLQRYSAVAFTIGNYGYLTTGMGGGTSSTSWRYNPDRDLWEDVDTFEGSSRYGAAGFAINGKGYITTGGGSSTSGTDDLWMFDPNASDDD